jgi:hypothetical protein
MWICVLVLLLQYGNCRFAKPDDIRKNVNTKRSIPLVAPPPASSSATSSASSSAGAAVAVSSAAPNQPLQDKKKQSSPIVVAAALPVAASAAPAKLSVASTTALTPPKKADKQLPKRMSTINNYSSSNNNNNVIIKQPRSSMDTNSTCSDTNTSMLIDDSDHSVSSKKRKVAPPPLTITTTTTAASSISSSYCGSSSNSGGKHHSKQLPLSKPTLTLRGILTEYYEMLNALENEYGIPSVASPGVTQPHHAHDFRKTLDAFLSVPYTDQLPESMLGLALQGYHHIKQTTMALWDELYRIYTSTGMGGGRKYSLSSSNNNTPPPRGPFGGGGGGNGSGIAGGHDTADSSGLGGKGSSSGYGPFSSSSLGNRGNSNNHNSNSAYRGRSRASGVEDPSDTDTLASNTDTHQGLCENDENKVETAPLVQFNRKAANSALTSTPESGSDQSLGKSEGSRSPVPQTTKVGKRASTGLLTGTVKASSSGSGRDASDHSEHGKRGLDRSGSSSDSNSTSSFGTAGSNKKGLRGPPGRLPSDTLPRATRHAPRDNGKDDGHDNDNFGAGGVALLVKADRKAAHSVMPSPESPRSVSIVEASLALEHKPGKRSSSEVIRSSMTLDPPQVDTSAKSAFSRWSTNTFDVGSIRNTAKAYESEPSPCQEPFKIVCTSPLDKKTMNASSSSVRRSWDVGQGGDQTPNAICSSRSRCSIGDQTKAQDSVGVEKQPEKNENMHMGVVLKRGLPPSANDSKVRVPHTPASAKTSPMEEPKKTVRPWKSWEQGLKNHDAMMPPLTNISDDSKDDSEASVLPVFRALAHKLAQTESIETEEAILPRQEVQNACAKHDSELCSFDQETTLKDETRTATSASQTTAATTLKEKLRVNQSNNNNPKEIDSSIETKTLKHEPKPTHPTRRLQQFLPPSYLAPVTSSEKDNTRENKVPKFSKKSKQVESSKHEWMQPCGWTAMAKPRDLNNTGVEASKSLIRLW